jgi:hypothetical protein
MKRRIGRKDCSIPQLFAVEPKAGPAAAGKMTCFVAGGKRPAPVVASSDYMPLAAQADPIVGQMQRSELGEITTGSLTCCCCCCWRNHSSCAACCRSHSSCWACCCCCWAYGLYDVNCG